MAYMTEAAEFNVDYAPHSLDFESLTFTIAVGNYRSRRIKEMTEIKLVEVKPASFVDRHYTDYEILTVGREDGFIFRSQWRCDLCF